MSRPLSLRWPRFEVFLAGALATVLLTLAPGCHRCDLVEAELRTKENELRGLRARLQQAELLNGALENEYAVPVAGVAAKPAIPPGFPTYSVKQITLARQTGGYDGDLRSGDKSLQVVVEPRDIDDQAVKVPGSLWIEVFQINREGLKTPLSSWEIPPNDLRRAWKNGLFSSGYYVVLPWKTWPATNRLRVVARFSAADGRVFETDKDITIRLPAAAS